MADKKISALTGASTPLAGTEVLPIVQSGSTVKVAVSDLTAGRAVGALSYSATVPNNASFQTAAAFSNATNADFLVRIKTNVTDIGPSTSTPLTISIGLNEIGRFSSGNLMMGATSNAANCRLLSENATGQQIGARYTGIATHYLSVESNGDAVFNRDGTVWARLINSSLDYQFTAGNLVQGTAAKGINFTANTPAAGMTSQLLNWYEEGTWTPTDGSGAGLSFTVGAASYTRVGRKVECFAWVTYPSTANGSAMAIGGLPFAVKSTNDGAGVSMYCSAGFQLFLRPDSTTVFVSVKNDNTSVTNANLSGALIGIHLTYFV